MKDYKKIEEELKRNWKEVKRDIDYFCGGIDSFCKEMNIKKQYLYLAFKINITMIEKILKKIQDQKNENI